MPLCPGRGSLPEKGRKLHHLSPPGDLPLLRLQEICPADHLFHGADAKGSHQFPHILRDEAHEIHHMLRLSAEAGPEPLVLGGDAHGAGVQCADPHHHAAHADQHCCGEAVFLRSQHGCDHYVPAAHQLSVRLQRNSSPEPVFHQRPVRLRKSQLPGESRAVNGGSRGGAGAAVIAGDQDHLCPGLRDARRDGPDARLAAELHVDPRPAVRVLQIIDQLRQVFDGINIVVRRRGDQRHAGHGVPGLRDPGVHLCPGKMTALAGLRALGHLDLDLLRAHEIGAGHAEAGGSHLLDLRICLRSEALLVLSAFSRVGPSAQTVHSDGHGLVGFLRNGAVAHGAGLEALHDLAHWLHLFQRDRIARRDKLQKASQGVGELIVHQRRISLELFVAPFPHCLLQERDHRGIPEMVLFVLSAPQLVEAYGIQRCVQAETQRVEGVVVAVADPFLDLPDPDAVSICRGTCEIAVDDFFPQSDAFKDPGGLIGLQGRDAHLCRDLHDALPDRLVVIRDRGVEILVQDLLLDQLPDALVGQIRIHRPGAEAHETCEMMHRSRLRALQHQRDGRALFRLHQVPAHRGDRQKGGDRQMILIHAPVREDDDIRAGRRCPVHTHQELLHRPGKIRAPVVKKRHRPGLKPRAVQRAELDHVRAVQHRLLHLQHPAVAAILLQEISVGAQIDRRVRDDLLPERVDGRVRHLGEQLLEVVEQILVLLREYRQRNIMPHGSCRFIPVLRHGKQLVLHLLVGVAEGAVKLVPKVLAVYRRTMIRQRDVLQTLQVPVQPLAEGTARRVVTLALFVRQNALFLRVHQQHPPGHEPALFHDMGRILGKDPHLRSQHQAPPVCHIPAGRPEPVPVQRRPQDLSVTEDHRGRPVPGLHHGGVIVIEIPFLQVHVPVVSPGLRNRDHHCPRKLHPVHHQELQSVVQHGGIRAVRADHRVHLQGAVLRLQEL